MKFNKLITTYFFILSLLIYTNSYAKCDGICRKKDYALNAPAGTKVNWTFHHPGSHYHHPCKIEEGHWHYGILNQNPNTCDCKANKTAKTCVCGSDIPAEHNDIVWYNNDN